MRQETQQIKKELKLNNEQAAHLEKEVNKVYNHIAKLQKSGMIASVYNIEKDIEIPEFSLRCLWWTQGEVEFVKYDVL